MKISACIITDARNLDRLNLCVKSLMNSVTEIIIGANHNSFYKVSEVFTDNEKVKVFEQEWKDDFASARNESIERASGDYILIIDSDEELMTEIKFIDTSFDMYFVSVQHKVNVEVLAEGFTSEKHIRLFRNIPEIRFKNKIHETVEHCKTDKMKVCNSEIVLAHCGYMGEGVLEEKLKRNQEILLQDTDNNIRDYLFMRHYYLYRDYDKVFEYGMKVIEDNKYIATFKAIAFVFLALTYIEKYKSEDMARQALSASLFYVPKQIQARWLLIDSFVKTKEIKAKGVILSQITAIEEITENKSSDIPNDIYIKQDLINKIKQEVIKWQ